MNVDDNPAWIDRLAAYSCSLRLSAQALLALIHSSGRGLL